MKLATLRLDGATAAARIDDSVATVIDGYADLSALLHNPDWTTVAANAAGRSVPLEGADYAPVVPAPGKILCVGLNYATHIAETGRDMPEYPTLFTKFADALTGAHDDVVVPEYASRRLDWEAELAVVIGRRAYQVSAADAHAHIAGYSVFNDYTMRDYQYRTLQWVQGKTFEKCSGFGPFLVTDYTPGTRIETRLDGELMQSGRTDDLIFKPAHLVEYISHIVTLRPGDIISTGTTSGVGHARKPPRHIRHGETVEIVIEGLGTVRNKTLIR